MVGMIVWACWILQIESCLTLPSESPFSHLSDGIALASFRYAPSSLKRTSDRILRNWARLASLGFASAKRVSSLAGFVGSGSGPPPLWASAYMSASETWRTACGEYAHSFQSAWPHTTSIFGTVFETSL
jgi:hypothetical protein